MKLFLIAAVANNNVIGKDNQLIWRMPADLKHFKDLTMGHILIMGRKTFESLGSPLKGRTTIVLSRRSDYDAQGCQVVSELADALKLVKDEKEVFIAGGAQIYDQSINLHQTRRIYLTRIYASFEGDAFFPEIDPNHWELIERTYYEPDDKNPYAYSFQTYKRKQRCK
jgi:dihydrofolate reductase